MVTQDKFKILVSRTNSIILSLAAPNKVWRTLDEIQKNVIPNLASKSRELKATIMVQTRDTFLYIGENATKSKDRNVLENRQNLTSHLMGSGGPDTIYDINSLDKDIYIYSGLEADFRPNCISAGIGCPNHTIELTEVIMPIRMKHGEKYLPSVVQKGDDLVLSMEGFEGSSTMGEITIVNGTLESVSKRFQVLLHSTMMYFSNDTEGTWKLSPTAVVVSQGYVHSISALDLEDGQDIKFDMNSTAKKLNVTSFTAARLGNDLYLTDIKAVKLQKYIKNEDNSTSRSYQKATTVIVTDFFKVYKFKSKKEYLFSDFNESSPFPTKINNVMVSLPGLNVILSNNKVLMEVLTGEEENIKGRKKREAVMGEENGLSSKRVLEEAPISARAHKKSVKKLQVQGLYYREN